MHRAEVLHRSFPPTPARPFQMERHYLVYAARGRMLLEDGGRGWSLQPARAALVRAGEEIRVTLPAAIQALSVLFCPRAYPPPEATLSVFPISPLARALLQECRRAGESPDDYQTALLDTLQQVCWRLATAPGWMPRPRHCDVVRALALTSADLTDPPSFQEIASRIGTSPRSLARRFAEDIGLTWRAALRRLRIVRAMDLLAEDPALPVAQAGFEVGYASLSAFNAAFREIAGRTPTDYRVSLEAPLLS